MSDARRLVMTRDQVEKVTGDNHQRIKEFEKLLNALSSDPVEPITVAITGDTTYTLANERGTQTILIPEAMLKASAGGPFTLTITTGVGDSVVVPIAASTDTILSGDLLFDIYIDSSGNVISKAWGIAALNSTGSYILDNYGNLDQFQYNVTVSSGASYTWTFPRKFVDLSYYSPGGEARSNVVQIILQENRPTFFTRTTTQMQFFAVTLAGGGNIPVDMAASGRWR